MGETIGSQDNSSALSAAMANNELESGNAGEVFANVIDNELGVERDRAVSLEQRGISVVTSSGILVSLVFGFGTLIQGEGRLHFPAAARAFLTAALLAFVMAATVSLLTNKPRPYRPLGVKVGLERIIFDLWNIPADQARRSIAEFRVSEVDCWRDNNMIKAAHLQRAIIIECCGVGLLAASMIVTLA